MASRRLPPRKANGQFRKRKRNPVANPRRRRRSSTRRRRR